MRLFEAGDDRWEWNISTALVLEYEAVLKRTKHLDGRPLSFVDELLDALANRANRHSIFYLTRPFLSDPDDEMVLELALASASDYIITHNENDFRDVQQFGVTVVTPAEFISRIK